jgi:flagellar hook protein FlgE
MSINRSLYIGLSGMSANAQALSQIGNNIANINTVGYKGTRAVFQDILGQNILGSSKSGSVGLGVRMTEAERLFKQGALLGTGLTTDLAIDGQGFFVLNSAAGETNNNFFSRAGQFHLSNEGFIVNPNGLKLMGYSADPEGVIGATLAPLKPVDTPLPA